MAQIDNEINLIVKKLKSLEFKYSAEIKTKRVLKKASRIVVDKLKDNTPVDTGELKKSMEFLPLNKSKSSVFVGPNYRKGGSHAHLVEYGHLTKNGKRIEGNPFIFKSYEQTKGQVLVNLTNELKLLQTKFERQL